MHVAVMVLQSHGKTGRFTAKARSVEIAVVGLPITCRCRPPGEKRSQVLVRSISRSLPTIRWLHTYKHTKHTHTYIHTYLQMYVHTYVRTFLHIGISYMYFQKQTFVIVCCPVCHMCEALPVAAGRDMSSNTPNTAQCYTSEYNDEKYCLM